MLGMQTRLQATHTFHDTKLTNASGDNSRPVSKPYHQAASFSAVEASYLAAKPEALKKCG